MPPEILLAILAFGTVAVLAHISNIRTELRRQQATPAPALAREAPNRAAPETRRVDI